MQEEHFATDINVGTNDLIDRQAAIGVLDEWKKAFEENGHKESAADVRFIRNELNNLPAAQHEPCEDAVSRAAIMGLRRFVDNNRFGGPPVEYVDLYDISKLPPVTPKQRTGKWINGHCSECGEHAPFWSMASTYYESKFCPECGAKMMPSND